MFRVLAEIIRIEEVVFLWAMPSPSRLFKLGRDRHRAVHCPFVQGVKPCPTERHGLMPSLPAINDEQSLATGDFVSGFSLNPGFLLLLFGNYSYL